MMDNYIIISKFKQRFGRVLHRWGVVINKAPQHVIARSIRVDQATDTVEAKSGKAALNY
jgi:hypothetical protein